MKRQIKFRGKRTDGVWVYGTNVYIPIKDKWKTRINGSRVDPATVGQFTGLLDRNGKEIYEGDIIKENDEIFEVFWCDDLAAFMHEERKPEPYIPKMYMMDCLSEDAEIIGNIHEQSKS